MKTRWYLWLAAPLAVLAPFVGCQLAAPAKSSEGSAAFIQDFKSRGVKFTFAASQDRMPPFGWPRRTWFSVSSIDASGTNISDQDIAALADGMKTLDFLTLDDTGVTDESLTHLKKIAGLRELSLRNTKVTAEGVGKMRSDFPGCKITGP